MTDREGTNEPGGADEIAAAHDALRRSQDRDAAEASAEHPADREENG